MVVCESCERHIQKDVTCPFCTRPAGGVVSRRMMMSLGAVVTPIVLAACYGGPAGYEPAPDNDGDGFFEGFDDCNDDDPAINPDASEICDDEIDNDCDGLIDAEDHDCDTDSDTDTDTE